MKHLKIPFAKLHGLGNDWIAVAGRDLAGLRSQRELRALARSATHRHEGLGADGLIVVLPPRSRQHDAKARFFNADGSEAEMSGNGIRCVAGYLWAAGRRSKPKRDPLRIETAAGVKCLETVRAEEGRWVFRVEMGAPILEPEKIPFLAPGAAAPVLEFPLETKQGTQRATVTSMGNPHCTLLVGDFEPEWTKLGGEIEVHSLFPHRTNVEFVRVLSRTEIEVRFWERGVGPTASSGTGSCAATVACILNGRTDRKVKVHTLAGICEVGWPEKGGVALTGPVERIAQGTYDYKSR